jgi:tetratricopeptide (TPR) repeat protein
MSKLSRLMLLVLVCVVALSSESIAQRKKKSAEVSTTAASEPVQTAPVATPATSSVKEQYAFKEKVFNLALQYNDGVVAKQALYEMMVLEPGRTELRDTLAMLYYNLNSWGECIFVAREILSDNPNKLDILEMKAVALKNLGLLRDAQDDFQKIYLKTDNILYLYEVATLQYQMKRYDECLVSLDILLKSKEIDGQQVNMPISQIQEQQVPMRAAVLNLRGIAAYENNNDKLARESYREALKIFPDFVMAKGNLAQMDKPAQSKGATRPAGKN